MRGGLKKLWSHDWVGKAWFKKEIMLIRDCYLASEGRKWWEEARETSLHYLQPFVSACFFAPLSYKRQLSYLMYVSYSDNCMQMILLHDCEWSKKHRRPLPRVVKCAKKVFLNWLTLWRQMGEDNEATSLVMHIFLLHEFSPFPLKSANWSFLRWVVG